MAILCQSIFIILFNAVFLFVQPSYSADVPPVHSITLEDDMINPVTADYITRAIDRAMEEKAQCLVIKLDTPGGLLTSTRQIVRKILAADVPVVVYIAPGGARAGSAGVFIAYASHLVAMAPSTNIGAAHPVELNGRPSPGQDPLGDLKDRPGEPSRQAIEAKTKTLRDGKTESSELAKGPAGSPGEPVVADKDPAGNKVLQDTIAFIKTLAEKRGRNIGWAISSVSRSVSATETEALSLGVIDLIASDETDLLRKIQGRTVALNNRTVVLKTSTAPVKHFLMDNRQRFFNVLANPNIAYILMILGFYGLLYEITHPGFGVPGMLGAIFLILAFFSLQALPTNFAGLALILFGLILFIVEVFVGFGILALGGIISMFLGSLLLFDASVPMMRVSLSVIAAFTLTTALITTFLVRAVYVAHRRKVRAGEQGMIGERAEVYTAVFPGGEGKVLVHGELWNAVGDEALGKGETVVVQKIEGLTLTVKKCP